MTSRRGTISCILAAALIWTTSVRGTAPLTCTQSSCVLHDAAQDDAAITLLQQRVKGKETMQQNKISNMAAADVERHMRRGDPDELSKDSLFNLAWSPETDSVAMGAVRVGADDDCQSWEGLANTPVGCYLEVPEHTLVKKWLPENATVMEFGARYGTTTCEIAKKLENSGNMVTVEPDKRVWTALENNIKNHHCRAHVLRGAISSTPLHMQSSGYGSRTANSNDVSDGSDSVPTFTFDEVEKAVGFKIDTLLIDCEGCAQHMMDQIGAKIEEQIQLILLEADMPDTWGDCKHDCMNYPKFFKFLENSGFEQIDKFNDCDYAHTGAALFTVCLPWVNHYAFKRKSMNWSE